MKAQLLTILLLVISNVFMTFAWYGHLKLQSTGLAKNWPLYAVILFSWGVALFMFQGEKLQWNHLAAFGCLILAVWFVFMPTDK